MDVSARAFGRRGAADADVDTRHAARGLGLGDTSRAIGVAGSAVSGDSVRRMRRGPDTGHRAPG